MSPKKPADSSTAKPVNPELPKEREAELKKQFDNLECDFKKPGDFVQILNQAKVEQLRTRELEANPAKRYEPTLGSMTPCGNGDFEALLDPNEWQGASGPIVSMNGSFPFASFTAGLSSGPINNANAHQTWVGPGFDPNVTTLSTTAPGSNGAVRIGNDVGNVGDPCSLLSKTFLVGPANAYITFWYALVMKCPHGAASFTVRVSDDASGSTIFGAFDFGNGSNTLAYAATNPMWTALGGLSDGDSVYKDWSCAQIDLSQQIGKVVTIEFVVIDCFIGKSAYAYVDSFCGGCKGSPSGTLSYDCEKSSHCGKGKLCFAYNLPTAKDPKTGQPIVGQVEIKLSIYQNGSLIHTLTSGPLGTGSSYCFDIDPTSITGLNPSLGGFDFTAIGAFTIGSTNLGSTHIGIPPEGVTEGRNNDYQIECKSCDEINKEQNALLAKECASKINTLKSYDCHCPDITGANQTGCGCMASATPGTRPHCIELELPKIKPCFSVKWGDSECDCLETNDVETLCITVCNCYTNITFDDLSVSQIHITNMDGTPVPTLPDGTPSAQIIPSGPICFGSVPPCVHGRPSCVSREVVLYTRGAKGGNYRLTLEGVCFSVIKHVQADACFVLPLCQD